MSHENPKELTVAIAGLGAIGLTLARRLDQGIEGLRLTAVAARDHAKAEGNMATLSHAPPLVALAELAERAEVVVECAPAACFRELAEAAVERGRILVTVSGGALLSNMDLVERAKETGARIVVPTGALLGLDAVQAAAQGEVERVTLVTRKPPGGLAGAPYLEERGIDLDGLAEPLKVFEGTAREGARGFPANVNVAAALGLAGVGPDKTRLEIWADPTVTRNTHRVEVEAASARFSMTIENVPSEENPRTGKITVLSVIAALKRLVAPLQVGT